MAKQIVTSIRINEELWKEAKIYAIKKGIRLSELLEKCLQRELKGGK
jgi:predicted HicB family RNase H-like nuclease